MSNGLKNMSHTSKLKIVGLPKRKLGEDLITACQHSHSEQTFAFYLLNLADENITGTSE